MSEQDVNTIDTIDNNNEEIPQIEAPIKIKKPVSPEKLEQLKYARLKGAEKKKEMKELKTKSKQLPIEEMKISAMQYDQLQKQKEEIVKPVEKEESVMMVIGGKVVAIDENGIQTKITKDSSVKKESLDDIRNEIAHSKGKYFVVGGSYITEAAAKMECQKWSKLNYKSTFIKVKGSSLIKIVLKRFVSGKDASNFALSVKTLPTNTISVQELNIAK